MTRRQILGAKTDLLLEAAFDYGRGLATECEVLSAALSYAAARRDYLAKAPVVGAEADKETGT
jgi:hypothetical protein